MCGIVVKKAKVITLSYDIKIIFIKYSRGKQTFVSVAYS